MHNISTIVKQAEKVILVVSPDKIVRSYRDVLFQTKCMVAFGAESLLLTLNKRGESIIDFNNLPISESGHAFDIIHSENRDANGR